MHRYTLSCDLVSITVYVSDSHYFQTISPDSVATQLRYSELFNIHLIANLLMHVLVKEFIENLVKLWTKVLSFLSHSVYNTAVNDLLTSKSPKLLSINRLRCILIATITRCAHATLVDLLLLLQNQG